MLEYLIKVIDNSLSVFLAASLLLAVRSRQEARKSPGRAVSPAWGLAAGFAAALMYAVLKRNTGLVVREYYDLAVLIPSVAASLFLLFTLGRSFTRADWTPGGSFRFAAFCVLTTWSAYCLPGLLLYPFEFSAGMDTIFDTAYLYRVTGYLLALAVVSLTSLMLCASAKKLSYRRAVVFLMAAVLIISVFHAMTIVQILMGRGLIARSKWLMGILMLGLTHSNWFMYVIMALVFPISPLLCAQDEVKPVPEDNPAQRRKKKAEACRRVRMAICVASGLLVSLTTITVGRSYANRAVKLSPPLEIAAEGGKILLPLESVNDGNLHRFMYKASDGTEVRYIVIRKSDAAYGVGLDACDVCGATGYYQRKDQVVCILCDVVMNISTIGFPGGCNPVPLKYAVTGGNLSIEAGDLEAERRRFR